MRPRLLVIVLLAALACGGKQETPRREAPRPGTTETRAPAPAPAGTQGEPVQMDPDREEAIRTGTPAEQLLAKYELLVDRIRMEREQNVFNIDRTIDRGLLPLAREHHRLLAEGDIDTTLTLQFANLATLVLAKQIYTQEDRHGTEVAARIADLRAMIPKHEKRPTP